jgi:hypothetical protein
MSIEKTFNPDYEYSFWFFKSKFKWVLEMLALIIDYEFAEEEVEGMLYSIFYSNDVDKSTWVGGLHYGKKGTMYITMALDEDDRDIVHILISSNTKFQSQLN